MTRIEPLGDRAFLATFEDEDRAAAWAEGVREAPPEGLAEAVVAYRSVGIYTDPELDDLDGLADTLRRRDVPPRTTRAGRLVSIPVLYDGEDLPEVAGRLGLTVEEVVRAHASRDYRVFALGFRPGFPYAGYLPDALRGLPRRDSPRTRVPAGSVAIVGRQTAVYPSESPGGWHLIGRTPLRIVDPESGFFPIRAGDRLRFLAIDREAFEARRGEWLGP